MSCLKISELRPAGVELFQDTESFLDELSQPDLDGISGGFLSFCKGLPTRWRRLKVVTQVKSKFVRSAGPIGVTYTAKTYVGQWDLDD